MNLRNVLFVHWNRVLNTNRADYPRRTIKDQRLFPRTKSLMQLYSARTIFRPKALINRKYRVKYEDKKLWVE